MELEHRVKVLEQEVQILKNQIQAALLDIQEQVLVHYYPSLRTEVVPAPPGAAQPPASAHRQSGDGTPDNRSEEKPATPMASPVPLERVEEGLEEPPASPAFQQAAYEQIEERPDEALMDTSVGPIIRRVSLEEEGRAPDEASTGPGIWEETREEVEAAEASISISPEVQSILRTAAGTDWAAFTTLAEWTIDSVEKVGAERMTKLIDMYAQDGFFTPEVKVALLQIVSLYYEDGWLEFEEEGEGWSQAGRAIADRERKRSLILRLIYGLQNIGTGREEQRG
jgi:hypothetical protein